MANMRQRLLMTGIVLGGLLLGCASPAGLIVWRSPLPIVHAWEEFLARHPLAPGENIRVTPLERTEAQSLSLVQIRQREEPHVHARHDLTVIMLRGTGTLSVGNAAYYRLKPGDAVFIPRGTPHHFVNEGEEPAAALVLFAPAFDGKDTVPVSSR
jgi:quercetin dioxygenase-like cupin family protein